jgi:predicted amidohydrolase YtcJ
MKEHDTVAIRKGCCMAALFFVLTAMLSHVLVSQYRNNFRTKDREAGVAVDPTIILFNAFVRTMDDANSTATAIAIAGNRILAVGSDAEVLALQTSGTRLIDLEGRTVVPGLIDDHGHRLQLAFGEGGLDGVVRAAEERAAEGFTTLHELYAAPYVVEALKTLADENRLAVRVDCYVPYNSNGGEDQPDWNLYPYTEKKDTVLRIVGIKVFADGGSVGSGAVTIPYLAGGSHGNLWKSQEQMDSTVAEIVRAGYPVAMHAIGDSGIGVGLNAFAHAFAGQGNVLRSRMEHLSIMREDLADQMTSLGVVASIQFTWANTTAVNYEQVYQPQVLAWCFPWRRMVDRGIVFAVGSDFPYTMRTQAMQCLSILATRKVQRGDTLPDWLDGDQLTVEEGLRAMTVTNAWVTFEEDVKGTITPGKLADLTVLSEDPLSVDPFDVRSISVEMTIMDGVIRHDQRGIQHTAVHDAGTFRIGIDDSGRWGIVNTGVGLDYAGSDNLYAGSLFVSYDSSSVAMDPGQDDYDVSTDGWVRFNEPGLHATEEASVTYEDNATSHPGKVRITQETAMWQNDPLLLVRYTINKAGLEALHQLFLGQYMDFDVRYWATNKCAWDDNGGLGFCYIYNATDATTPYIGMAMFDSSGRSVSTAATFLRRQGLDQGQESVLSAFMRSGIIDEVSPDSSDYALLLSAGPYDIDVGASIAPFTLAIVVGMNVGDLETAVQSAYRRAMGTTAVRLAGKNLPRDISLSQNYPNPFNPSTMIEYDLPRQVPVRLTVFDILGREVKTLVSAVQEAGYYKVVFDAHALSSGVYYYRIQAGDFVKVKRLVLLK